jgi:uncharacterized protein YodC (DUF2158 family)
MAEFKEGDRVQLKSGGPIMTIEELGNFSPSGPENGARCVWFDNGQAQERVFSIATLNLYAP